MVFGLMLGLIVYDEPLLDGLCVCPDVMDADLGQPERIYPD